MIFRYKTVIFLLILNHFRSRIEADGWMHQYGRQTGSSSLGGDCLLCSVVCAAVAVVCWASGVGTTAACDTGDVVSAVPAEGVAEDEPSNSNVRPSLVVCRY